MLAEAQQAVPETADPLDALRSLLQTYRAVALQYRAHYALMFALDASVDGASDETRARAPATFGHLVTQVSRAVSAGALAGAPAVIARALFGLCHGLVCVELAQALPLPPADQEAAYLAAVDRLLAGFRTAAPR